MPWVAPVPLLLPVALASPVAASALPLLSFAVLPPLAAGWLPDVLSVAAAVSVGAAVVVVGSLAAVVVVVSAGAASSCADAMPPKRTKNAIDMAVNNNPNAVRFRAPPFRDVLIYQFTSFPMLVGLGWSCCGC
ncbi:MAG TPA: hypothetical protein VNT56_01635 [Acidimicrobiales bacterium]|nr:hypothetical protein [Acidimicrobiales bacterium]